MPHNVRFVLSEEPRSAKTDSECRKCVQSVESRCRVIRHRASALRACSPPWLTNHFQLKRPSPKQGRCVQ